MSGEAGLRSVTLRALEVLTGNCGAERTATLPRLLLLCGGDEQLRLSARTPPPTPAATLAAELELDGDTQRPTREVYTAQ